MEKQQQVQGAETAGFKQLWSEILRRKYMVIGIMIIGMALTCAYTAYQKVLYRSTASLLIDSFVPTPLQTTNPYGETGVSQDVIKANRILAESKPVRDRAFALALKELGDEKISKDLDIQAHSDGQLIYLQALDTNKERAAVYANAWSDAFVEEMRKRAVDR